MRKFQLSLQKNRVILWALQYLTFDVDFIQVINAAFFMKGTT
jgi:hypothetical protein